MAMYDRESFLQGSVLNLPHHDWNQRRFAVDRDRLYGVLSYQGPVVAMDAATGRVLNTFAGTESSREVMVHQDRLFVLCGEPPEMRVFDTTSGAMVWSQSQLKPSAVVVYDRQLCLLNPAGIHAFEIGSFKKQWVSSSKPSAGFLVDAGSVVLGRERQDRWLAYSPRDGREIWSYPCRPGPASKTTRSTASRSLRRSAGFGRSRRIMIWSASTR